MPTLFSNKDEIILAEEQGASKRVGSLGSTRGTLVLTNRRLVFVKGNEFVSSETGTDRGHLPYNLSFSDICDIGEIQSQAFDPESAKDNLSLDLDSVANAIGHKGGFSGHPSLTLNLATRDGSPKDESQSVTFHEEMTGKRKKHINDWTDVIMKIKSGEFNEKISSEISRQKSRPGDETLVGKVLYIMGDMQTKGVFEIESELKKRFQGYGLEVDLNSEKIENECASLIKQGWIIPIIDKVLISAYRKASPLGDSYDLSS